MRSASGVSDASGPAMTSTADPPSEAAARRGAAVYFDGTSSARNDVIVEAGATGLRILIVGGQ